MEVRGIFLDISKAFDRFWNEGLIFKIQSTGISGTPLKLTKSFLKLASAIFDQFFILYQDLSVLEIFKFSYFHVPLFFSLPAIALEVDPR